MNEDNLAYLKDQLRYLGISERIDKDLAEKMQTPRSFSLMYGVEFGQDAAFAVLKFKKSTESDLFFLTNYTLHLVAAGVGPRLQTFPVQGKSGTTMDEGYNLLKGRAVLQKIANGNGEDYLAWQQLDFTHRDKNNDYRVTTFKDTAGAAFMDAATALTIFPMKAGMAEEIIRSLAKGNIHPAVFNTPAGEVLLFLQYDPAAKEVILYDKDMRLLGKDAKKDFIHKDRLPETLLPKKRVKSHRNGLSIK